MFQTIELLKKHGHTVVPFAMQHPQNFESEYSKYWPSYIDFKEELKTKSLTSGIKVGARHIYSLEAKKCIARLLDIVKPDVVHIHNIMHHLTPSILSEIKRRNIPVVWTLHDYTIICPNTTFLTEQGVICEACKKHKYFMAPIKRCKKNSFIASASAMLENYTHRIMNLYRHVDLFISPSDFLREKFNEFGFPGRIVTLHNFIDTDSVKGQYENSGYMVYIGRLNHIKGVDLLVNAIKAMPDVQLKIVGNGELLEEFQKERIPNVEFVGFQSGDKLKNLVKNAACAVVPSKCYENFPYSVLEPLALGKPVIGSRIGGIPEMVKDGETGYLFESGSVKSLQSAITKLFSDKENMLEMGRNARQMVEENMSAEVHYKKLIALYRQVMTDFTP